MTEERWLHRQEILDRHQERDERREILMDEFHSPLPRVILQRLRNAHDEGRKISFRSEFNWECGPYFSCIAQSPRTVPVVIIREKSLREFKRLRLWIEVEWERLEGK